MIRRHVLLSVEQMFDEADGAIGPMTGELSLADEIHLHMAMILLNRIMCHRYGLYISKAKVII
jgi:hypothetical protein